MLSAAKCQLDLQDSGKVRGVSKETVELSLHNGASEGQT